MRLSIYNYSGSTRGHMSPIANSRLLSLWRHSHYNVSRLRRSQPPFSLWRHSLLSWPRPALRTYVTYGHFTAF